MGFRLTDTWIHGYILVVAYGLTLLWLGYSLGLAMATRRFREEVCEHRWEYRSLDGWDHHWSRKCLLCPRNEQLERNQVPFEIRSRSKGFRG